MKIVLLTSLLVFLISLTSGCATILGGIIGHQSGETCAGMAIGAAFDFGDGIARGISQTMANPEKEFRQKSEINAKCGTIQLPGNAFTTSRMIRVNKELQDKFMQNGWTCSVIEKSAKTGLFCKDDFKEKWECSTAQNCQFTLNLHVQQDEDQELSVQMPDQSQAERAEITMQIYMWLEEISAGKT